MFLFFCYWLSLNRWARGKMLESRIQPSTLSGEAIRAMWIIREGLSPLLWCGNMGNNSKSYSLKYNWAIKTRLKQDLVLLRQLRENLNFFTKLRRGGKFLELTKWGGTERCSTPLCPTGGNVSYRYLSLSWSLVRCLQILCGILCSRTLGFKNIEQLSQLSYYLVLWKWLPSAKFIWHCKCLVSV